MPRNYAQLIETLNSAGWRPMGFNVENNKVFGHSIRESLMILAVRGTNNNPPNRQPVDFLEKALREAGVPLTGFGTAPEVDVKSVDEQVFLIVGYRPKRIDPPTAPAAED